MAKQVNIFVENKAGRFKKVTETLEREGINLRAVEIQDRGEFGIMKLLVSDPEKALVALTDVGLAVALKDIIAIAIEDKPGGLSRLADVFDSSGINMLDAYGFVISSGSEAVLCAEVENIDIAVKAAREHGFRLLDDAELYDL